MTKLNKNKQTNRQKNTERKEVIWFTGCNPSSEMAGQKYKAGTEAETTEECCLFFFSFLLFGGVACSACFAERPWCPLWAALPTSTTNVEKERKTYLNGQEGDCDLGKVEVGEKMMRIFKQNKLRRQVQDKGSETGLIVWAERGCLSARLSQYLKSVLFSIPVASANIWFGFLLCPWMWMYER